MTSVDGEGISHANITVYKQGGQKINHDVTSGQQIYKLILDNRDMVNLVVSSISPELLLVTHSGFNPRLVQIGFQRYITSLPS